MKSLLKNLTIFVFILFTATTSHATQVKEIVMAAPRTLDSHYGNLSYQIFKEAFKKLGIKLIYKSCSPLDCSAYAKAGMVDGELGRTSMFQSILPDLVRVSESIISIRISGFSTDRNIRLNSLEELKDRNYKIAFLSGSFYLDRFFKNQKVIASITKVNHWKTGLAKLLNKEIDIFIGIEKTVQNELKQEKYSKIINNGVLKELPLYAYLNKKHKNLALKLTKILKKMKSDGTIDKILD